MAESAFLARGLRSTTPMKQPTAPHAIVVLTSLVAALTFVACDKGEPTAPTEGVALVRSTTSFGMCLGYCRSALEITADHTTYRLFDDRTAQPVLERTVATSAAEWQAVSSAVDRATLEGLPSVIGCPDCADGGAESLKVLASGWSKAVAFEYGAAVPQLHPLVAQVRDIRDRLDRELHPR